MENEGILHNSILLVDDNEELRLMLKKAIEKEGYKSVQATGSVSETLKLLGNGAFKPDLIILDINLPDGDGFSLFKSIREIKSCEDTPILFLSARDKDADRLRGLGLGADDYMVKPFLKKELLLRMRAILKRSSPKKDESKETGIIRLGSREVNLDSATVSFGNESESLTVKELKILEKLNQNRGKIVTFDDLCKAVWDAQYYTYENTVMVHMRRLREKVEEDPSHPRWIITQRGIGYRLNTEAMAQKSNGGGQSVTQGE